MINLCLGLPLMKTAAVLAVPLPVPLGEPKQGAHGVHIRCHVLPPSPSLREDEATPLKQLQIMAHHAMLLA